MSNDLTFFTNEGNSSLLDRFQTTLKEVEYFDVLVGYFRTSGFHKIYESFENIEKIRILVGLNVGRQTYEIIEEHQKQLDFESHKRTKETFAYNLTSELELSEDNYNVELGVKKFIEFLKSGKMEIKAHPSNNIHAKVCISRFFEKDRDYGRVITGSSNFTASGLSDNYEFNVELKNSADVKYALDKFEKLWKEAVDISEVYVDTIDKKTWLNDKINPYELYLKFLYEYFKEDINMDEDFEIHLPEGYLELKYQKQAVLSAKKILDAYDGVFLADVVGLGKTYISALLAQQLPGKKLIICPPVLKEYWEDTFFEFGIGGFQVESLGKLDQIIKKGTERFEYIFIDEAHRFRNEYTQGFELLHQICFKKKVILVSATPLNNKTDDIFSQIRLFQSIKKSTIPGVPNLKKFFTRLSGKLKKCKKGTPEYFEAVKEISNDVREKVLKYIMVRRTRTEIVRYFNTDIKEQGLFFPELSDPKRIVYNFDDKIEGVFNETIQKLKSFKYSRYIPLLYLEKKLTEFEIQSQRNIGGFMKGILVKRLESSFYAFKKSLRRFVKSYEDFINMFENGTVYISKKVNVYDLLESDNEEKLLKLVDDDKAQTYKSDEFSKEFIEHLKFDLELLKEIEVLWKDIEDDPKIDNFIKELKGNKVLKNKKLIVFTESSETGEYLYEKLNEQFNNKVLFFCSGGGKYAGENKTHPTARDLIKENYDPGCRINNDDISILISTDVLAEGINLHRSNIVINYDLPWNPTKVLQRTGRVNRVGTEHKNIYIFNFFPTSQSDEHLGLENNIKAKIQAFHETLGEDARYLTEEEELFSRELFGDRLYKKLNSKESLESENEEERSELEYLREIQRIRDDESDVFEKIKRLPKKARSCREELLKNKKDGLISFFRKGRLKKFYLSSDNVSEEIAFLDAVDFLKCNPKTQREAIPKEYYDLLELNKEQFEIATSPVDMESDGSGGRSNEDYVIKRLKANDIKHFKGFTEDDEEYVKLVLRAFENGNITKNASKKLKKELEKEVNPLKVVSILKKNISDNLIYAESNGNKTREDKREVILSEYLLKKD